MGLFKLGILFIVIGILTIPPLLLVNTVKVHSKETIAKKKILGTAAIKPVSNLTTNLTLKPQDNINVIPVVIIEVVDIDSVRVLLNDGMEIVDLIGVKVPTDYSQNRYEKCYAETIEQSIQKIALGKKAFMIDDTEYVDSDVSQKYVFLEDLTFLNQELVKKGITSAVINEDYMYKEEFADVRKNAEDTSIGVWLETCEVTPTPKRTKLNTKTKATPTPIKNPYAHLLPSATSTLTPTPTNAPEKLEAVTKIADLDEKPGSLNPEILFVLINNHRKSIGKASFEKDSKLCQLAVDRGPELYDEIMVNGNVHAGLQNRNLPFWITENM
ncbi:MAG TPA: thermonuclease family protein, partial [Ignavibacteriaceae bacterium]